MEECSHLVWKAIKDAGNIHDRLWQGEGTRRVALRCHGDECCVNRLDRGPEAPGKRWGFNLDER